MKEWERERENMSFNMTVYPAKLSLSPRIDWKLIYSVLEDLDHIALNTRLRYIET